MRFIYLALIVLAGASCSGNASSDGGEETGEPFDAYVINEADWVETDLGSISPLVPITVKLPKDAVLEKNGNGGVDAKLGDYYVITIGQPAVSSVGEAIGDAKSLTVDDKTYYEHGKLLVEESNGFVCSFQPKAEGANTYEPESHFFYVIETPGMAHFTFEDNKAFGSNLPGSAFPEATAKKVYELIKNSARVNE